MVSKEAPVSIDPSHEVLIRRPHEGEQLGRGLLRAALPELTVVEYRLDTGGQPGQPHYHARHADSFYVLDGELEFRIDGKAVRAAAGSLIIAPPRAVHAFPVAISAQARFLNLHTPGGFERYLRELTAMRAREEAPTREFYESHDQFMV